MRIVFLLILFAGILEATVGCAPRNPKNIILIIVDTLRADHLGCYGGRDGVSPAIDMLAAEGQQFMHAYSAAPWTEPAIASILTSTYPSQHGVLKLFDSLSDENVTLSELLRKQNYVTSAVVSHELLTTRYGFGQGFDYFNQNNVGGHDAITSSAVTRDAIEWIDEHKDERFFLMLHYFDPHYVYKHHPEFNYTQSYTGDLKSGEDIWSLRDKRDQMTSSDILFLRQLYDEEISYTDKYIGELLDHLDKIGIKDKTIIVLTGDHGEEFMTHGWIGHTRTLYQELVHVPLIIRDPDQRHPGKVDENVSTMDIVPTLLDLEKIPYEKTDFEGESLASRFGAADTAHSARPIFFEVSFGHEGDTDRKQREQVAHKKGVLQDHWKLIYDELSGRSEMYDIAQNPSETHNVINQLPDVRKRLEAALMTWLSKFHSQRPLRKGGVVKPSQEELNNLRSLGYIE